MIERCGNMFTDYNTNDHYLITTNSVVTTQGKLVMGAGNALEAKNRFDKIDGVFGDCINRLFGDWPRDSYPHYGCIPDVYKNIGMFQTKYHWRDPSPIDLIRISVDMFSNYVHRHPMEIFHLPFPGINNGGLRPGQVYPIIMRLPNNVVVWRLQ